MFCRVNKHLKSIILVFLAIYLYLYTLPVLASHKYKKGKTYACRKWDVIDISFKTVKKRKDPFDVKFGATFLGPDNSRQNITGFYNDDLQYLLRFSPSKSGLWTFTTYSNIPELSGKQGKIQEDSGVSCPVNEGEVLFHSS